MILIFQWGNEMQVMCELKWIEVIVFALLFGTLHVLCRNQWNAGGLALEEGRNLCVRACVFPSQKVTVCTCTQQCACTHSQNTQTATDKSRPVQIASKNSKKEKVVVLLFQQKKKIEPCDFWAVLQQFVRAGPCGEKTAEVSQPFWQKKVSFAWENPHKVVKFHVCRKVSFFTGENVIN